MKQLPGKSITTKRLNLSFERSMAILAAINLVLVVFDLSYVRFRNFWLQGRVPIPGVNVMVNLPILSDRLDSSPITRLYDPIKGIEPHRDTVAYLQRVNDLEALVRVSGLQGLRSPAATVILTDLCQRSQEMVETNPFQVANKSGTLEKIKNEMRRLIYGSDHREASSKEAFCRFWSADYLAANSPEKGLEFFDSQIRPLMATNYYRNIDESGGFTEEFWRIDIWFALIFLAEFLARTYYISRHYKKVNWLEAMVWRWYDIPLFLPFWRWLRVISVIARLHEARLVNLEALRIQFNRYIATNLAEELTEVIILNAVNQLQNAVNSGDLARQALSSLKHRYIDLNDVNEIEAIAHYLFQTIAYKVLPTIQPDLEAWLRHNVEFTLSQSSAYQSFQGIPGMNDLTTQLRDRLVSQVVSILTETTQSAYQLLTVDDPEGDRLFNTLVQKFGESLGANLQEKQTLTELQSLVSAFLEEFKVNYVSRLGDEDMAQLLEETKRLRRSYKP